MQFSVETVEGLERKLTVEVPSEKVDLEVSRRLNELKGKSKIKGFRPGKVPAKVIHDRYGKEVREEVVAETIRTSLYEAVLEEKLEIASAPQVEPESMDEGQAIKFTATFEVYPQVTLTEFSELKVERPIATIVDSDVDAMLSNLQNQRSEWEVSETAAEEGDRVVIDFSGTIDGEEFPGNSAEQMPVTLGGKRLIEGFEEGLIGAKADEERVLDLKFPDDYAGAEVAGKGVRFEVKVSAVEKQKLPEIDDEFAAAFGVQEGGVEALRGEIRKSMESEAAEASFSRTKQGVVKQLLELIEFDLPKGMIAAEADAMAENMRKQLAGAANPEQSEALDSSLFEEQARERVKLGLIMRAITEQQKIGVEEADMRAYLDKMANSSGVDVEQLLNWLNENKDKNQEVHSTVLERKVFDWLIGEAQVADVETPFKELMGEAQQA